MRSYRSYTYLIPVLVILFYWTVTCAAQSKTKRHTRNTRLRFRTIEDNNINLKQRYDDKINLNEYYDDNINLNERHDENINLNERYDDNINMNERHDDNCSFVEGVRSLIKSDFSRHDETGDRKDVAVPRSVRIRRESEAGAEWDSWMANTDWSRWEAWMDSDWSHWESWMDNDWSHWEPWTDSMPDDSRKSFTSSSNFIILPIVLVFLLFALIILVLCAQKRGWCCYSGTRQVNGPITTVPPPPSSMPLVTPPNTDPTHGPHHGLTYPPHQGYPMHQGCPLSQPVPSSVQCDPMYLPPTGQTHVHELPPPHYPTDTAIQQPSDTTPHGPYPTNPPTTQTQPGATLPYSGEPPPPSYDVVMANMQKFHK